MNPKKLKALFILGLILLIIVFSVAMIISRMTNRSTSDENEENQTSSYQYRFDQTVDLDKVDPKEDGNYEFGTDSPNYGVLNEYYDNTDYFFEDRDLYVQDYDGYHVVSEEWRNEGYGLLVNEPTFGTLDKFILSHSQASAKYNDVKMKNVTSYIKELKELGFTDIIKDEKNGGADYYIFSAKKGENRVTLNYEKGSLLIVIF